MVDTQGIAGIMWTKFVFFLLSVSTVYGYGEYIVTHTPSHVTFRQTDKPISSSELSKVLTSTYGFTANKDFEWDGLGQTSLFARPKANVVVSVEGVPHALNVKQHKKYHAQNDDAHVSTASVTTQLQTNVAANPLIVDFSTDNSLFGLQGEHPELFSSLPTTLGQLRGALSEEATGALNASREADLLFLGELHIITGILHALASEPGVARDSVPDFFHLRVQGLQRLVEEYGQSSPQLRQAITMLEQVIDQVTSEMRRLYSDNVIIQVITSEPAPAPAPLSRRARSLLQAADTPAADKNTAQSLEDELVIAPAYTDMYPIVFNLMLWGGIAYALVIFAIAYGIWVMDPGKDSIIYRMTSTRKKDA